jgi:hypothetical protein
MKTRILTMAACGMLIISLSSATPSVAADKAQCAGLRLVLTDSASGIVRAILSDDCRNLDLFGVVKISRGGDMLAYAIIGGGEILAAGGSRAYGITESQEIVLEASIDAPRSDLFCASFEGMLSNGKNRSLELQLMDCQVPLPVLAPELPEFGGSVVLE